MTERSAWQRPAAPIFTITSLCSGSSRSNSSIDSGLDFSYGTSAPILLRTAARIFIGNFPDQALRRRSGIQRLRYRIVACVPCGLLEAPDCFSPPLLKFGECPLARIHHVLPCGLIRSANLVGHLASLFGFGLHLLHGLLIVVASLLAHLLKTFLIVLHLRHPDVALSLQLVGEVQLHHVGSPSHTRLVTRFPARVLATLPPPRACSRRSR